MASSRADWVRGEARLISSPSRMLVNTGPGWKRNWRVSGSNTEAPRMSVGRRSGVNWTRWNSAPTTRARALARVVLPVPGTSSSNTWPPLAKAATSQRMARCCPSMTPSMAAVMRPSAAMASSISFTPVILRVGRAGRCSVPRPTARYTWAAEGEDRVKANELKRGQVVNVDGRICMVRDVQAKSPSSRGGNTLYKVVFRDVLSRQKVEGSYKGDDVIPAAELVRRPVQLLYTEDGAVTVMDTDDYNQFTLDQEAIEAELPYITDDMSGLQLLLVEGAPAGLELPGAVELVVTEC